MKFRTTKKYIIENGGPIISVPYCSLQTLLRYEKPVAYTAGRNGWGADIYTIGGVTIVTGYAPFGNITPDYDTLDRYEKEAKRISFANSQDVEDYGMKQGATSILLKTFLKEVTE